MRYFTVLAAAAALSACDRSEPAEPSSPTVAATPAAVSWDGADYADEAAKLAHGKRLARLLDCTGCHGENLQGKNVTADEPEYGDMNAPNLTLKLADYSDPDLAKFLRSGTPKDGRELWFMPVESYQFLSERDLAALTAFLRSFTPAGTQLPPIRKGAGFLKEIKDGGIGHAAQQVARLKANPPPDLGPKHGRGRQLARMACTGCHNGQLEGYQGFTPNLDVAGAYTPAELTQLLTTGKGKSKANLGLMTSIARFSFSQLTPAEREAIVGYVLARANREQAPQ
ncbi:cytochrome c [Sphingomonas mesophila]|uniref:cytochrome c n=1 Tax=Sphingomonas mesophila TaxID=2303576 RepID=UPI000E572A6F|nr:cytochrome c [Sphingomonas mesophila]